MSAFLVSENHIRFLVAAMRDHRVGEYVKMLNPYDAPGEQTDIYASHVTDTDLGQMLWDENAASVNYRYTEADSAPTFTMKRTMDTLANVQKAGYIFKAIACYEYQSCEHPGWSDSIAKQLCDALRSKAETITPGYESAPWGID